MEEEEEKQQEQKEKLLFQQFRKKKFIISKLFEPIHSSTIIFHLNGISFIIFISFCENRDELKIIRLPAWFTPLILLI